MKITLDLPNEIKCAFLGYVYIDESYRHFMGCSSLDTNDLQDGNEIKLPRDYNELDMRGDNNG